MAQNQKYLSDDNAEQNHIKQKQLFSVNRYYNYFCSQNFYFSD